MASAAELKASVAALADPKQAQVYARFFKTGPGEYGAGDRFIGVKVPSLRRIAKEAGAVSKRDILTLLHSPIHEHRFLALLLWVRDYKRGDAGARERIYRLYLANTASINNWDLVDVSARDIVGAQLLERSKALERSSALDRSGAMLGTLARSPSLWERRIAIIATHAFLRAERCEPTIAMAVRLLQDDHDLIHKAVGWMLREMGVRCGRETLERFLAAHVSAMPRTMLRYAIEHLPPAGRRVWLQK